MENRFQKFMRLVFGKPKVLPLWTEKKGESFIRQRPPNPDELALGWADGEDDETGGEITQLKGVKQSHRDAHFYIVGATRSGKTKFLESLIEQDIKNGLGFGVIDPHGDLTEDVKGYLWLCSGRSQEFVQEKVVLIDPTDENRTVAFNPLEKTRGESSARVASELTEAFKKIWKDSWGARMEHLLKNTLIALVENNLTLAELHPFLTDSLVRRKVLEKVNHAGCREYFERFNSLRVNTQDEWMESTLNKVDAFLFDDNLRQMLSSPKSSFNLREVMDEGKILLVKLDKGRLKGNADLLGSLLLAKIQAAAFSRTDLPESKRQRFYLYIDEFQNFATESFSTMLAEAGKYKLALILAHQNLAQLPPPLRATILSNCGLQAYFRISRDDANILAKESLASIYSTPPGWEEYIKILQELHPRVCFIKNKIDGGVIAIQTIDQPPPHELAETDEDEFAGEIAECEIGKKYLRERKTIEAEYKARRRKLLEVEEPETFAEPAEG
jgi:type IV secretory pathway TraG/TraD family ATPase VirD4